MPPQRQVAFPVVIIWIHDDAFHGSRGVVSRFGRRLPAITLRNDDRLSVRIEQNFRWIEPQPLVWRLRTCHAETINLPGRNSRHEHVPVVISSIRYGIELDRSRWSGVSFRAEQQ